MGLSASQARLLSLTARMHDIEYSAQNIMNKKVELATQEDTAYQRYCDALDSKKIQVAFANGTTTSYVDANFANVCTFDETGNRRCQYALTDAESGKMIVDSTVHENYEEYQNDKYSFAWAMLGFSDSGENSDFSWSDNYGNNVGSINAGDGDEAADGHYIMLMTDVERIVFDKHKDDSAYPKLKTSYDQYQEALQGNDLSSQKEAMKNFREALYSYPALRAEIYDLMRVEKTDDKEADLTNKNYKSGFPESFDESLTREFDYYLHLFEGIQEAGGCVSVTDFSNKYDNDNDWFNTVINSGRAVLNIYKDKGNEKGWVETSVATTTNENYLQSNKSNIELKKIEAKYEHELEVIKRKDSEYDKDLTKLETERSALKTEEQTLKTVIKDNIQRNFKIFS